MSAVNERYGACLVRLSRQAGEWRWGLVGESAYMEVQLRYVGRQVPREFCTSRNPARFASDNASPPRIVYGPEGE